MLYIDTWTKPSLQTIQSAVAMGGKIINAGDFGTKITKDFLNVPARNMYLKPTIKGEKTR